MTAFANYRISQTPCPHNTADQTDFFNGLLIRTGPTQMKAVMAAVIEAKHQLKKRVLGTGEAYEAYKAFCKQADIRSLTGRAFGDVLAELDLYCLVRCRIVSRGRYGRSREIFLDLPEELVEHIYRAILSDLEIRRSPRPSPPPVNSAHSIN